MSGVAVASHQRLPPRSDGLDPRLAALIEALARDAARMDHQMLTVERIKAPHADPYEAGEVRSHLGGLG